MSDLELVVERFEVISEITNEIDLGDLPALKQTFLNDLENNRISFQTALSNLDFEEKTVLEHDEDYFIITIPIVNENYNMLSNFTITYDETFNLLDYSETHFQESENGFFKVMNYLNGVLISETETDVEFIENAEFERQLQEFEESFSNPRMRGVLSCLKAVAGIGTVMATLIVATCSFVCLVSRSSCGTCFASLGTLGAGAMVAAACFGWR